MIRHKDATRARRLLHLFARCIEKVEQPEMESFKKTIEDEYGLRVGDIPGPFRFGQYDPNLHLTDRGKDLVKYWMYSRWPNLKKEFGLIHVRTSPDAPGD